MSATRVLAIAALALVLAAAIALEWAARRPASKIPTFTALCGLAMRYRIGRLPVGRIALLGCWWWLGWHFLAR